jgi:hypothetical protein
LASYYEQQLAKFGAQKVHVIQTRDSTLSDKQGCLGGAVWAAIMLTGVIWILAGAVGSTVDPRNEDFIAWCGLGILVLFLFGLLGLLKRFTRQNSAASILRKHPDACIVIGPTGLAMVQGELQGIVAWHEIVGVSSRFSQWLRTVRVSGLQIRVRGGEIIVHDIYEMSPPELETLVRRNLGTDAMHY